MYKFLSNIFICVFLLNYSIRYVMCECCCYLKSEFTSKVDSKSRNFLPKPIGTKNIKIHNTNNTNSDINNDIKIPNINTTTNTNNTNSDINNDIKIPNINTNTNTNTNISDINNNIKIPNINTNTNTNNTNSDINNDIKIPNINTNINNTTSNVNNNIRIPNTKIPNINTDTPDINNNIKIPNIDNFNGTLPVGVNGLSVNPIIKPSSNIVNNTDGFKGIFINSITDNNFTGEFALSKIIKNNAELSLITNKIKANLNLDVRNLKLLYRASVDGDKAAIFHKKCDQAKNTIVLIETDKGKRFGGFTSCSWEGNCEDKPDESAFIFSLDKMKTYDKKLGEDAIGCYPTYGPIFLGCQIRIFNNAFTKGGTTFEKECVFYTEEDYELTGGDQQFNVKEIEVYEVIFN